MRLKLGEVRLRVGFLFAAFLALAAPGGAGGTLLPLFSAALGHEAAHLFCLRAFGCRGLTLSLLPGGARLEGNDIARLPYRRAFLAALAGPACNALLAVLTAAFLRFRPAPFARTFLRANLTLGGVNLLPLSFLDGGAALTAVLSQHKKGAPPSLRASDLILTVLLACLSAGLLVFGIRADLLLAFTGYCIVYQLLRR